MIAALLVTAQAVLAPPAAVRTELDGLCPSWRLAQVLPEIDREVRSRTPSWPANLIPGDFNADKKTDVALLVDCRGLVQLIAFLSNDSGFSMQVLEKAQPLDPRQFLHLIREEYEYDAIGVEYEAIGGHAWVFREGRWQSITR